MSGSVAKVGNVILSLCIPDIRRILMNMIETRSLTKHYGSKAAVRDLSLTVVEGELFSLLGVNGAGKTTTIRMLSCLSEPTSGEAFVGGFSCEKQKREINRQKRNTWPISPITRKPENPKVYKRKKKPDQEE